MTTTDVFDRASDLEQMHRDLALEQQQAVITPTPQLGCETCDCNGEGKGKACQYYAACLQDWSKREASRRRNGK